MFSATPITKKWIRFNIHKLEERLLIVVIKINKEKMKMQQMDYERDYDVLTNLLNRRAFKEKE